MTFVIEVYNFAILQICAEGVSKELAFASISLGQYVPLDSPVHSLDPRAKLLLTTVIVTVIFPVNSLTEIACCALALWGAMKLSALSFAVFVRFCRPVLFLAVFSFIFNFIVGLREFYDGGGIPALASALRVGVTAASRLLLLVSFAALLPLTTAPVELTDGLESLLSPFRRVGLPAHEFAMMMGVALRFVPLLMEETDRIVMAQLSRGAKLDQGSTLRRVIAFFPVVIPLFVIIFRRAEELALAMEARGYRGGEGRTRRRPLMWKKRDTGATIFVALLGAVFTFLRIFLL